MLTENDLTLLQELTEAQGLIEMIYSSDFHYIKDDAFHEKRLTFIDRFEELHKVTEDLTKYCGLKVTKSSKLDEIESIVEVLKTRVEVLEGRESNRSIGSRGF